MRCGVVVDGNIDLSLWESEHAVGRVPDRAPYGLDRMSRHGIEVEQLSGDLPRSRGEALGRKVARRVGRKFEWGLLATRRPSVDVVFAWHEGAGAVLSHRHGECVPVVSNVIWLTDRRPSWRSLDRVAALGLERTAAVTVLSSAQVAPLVSEWNLDPRKISVIPFGIDATFFAPEPGVERDPDLLVAVGNDRDRDWPAMVEAFIEVRRHRPSTRLVVVSRQAPTLGSGEPPPGVQHKRSLDHRELRRLVQTASASIVLTRPNLHVSGITAALESLSLGVPVVMSDHPGTSDYAAAGDGLIRVRPGVAGHAAHRLLDILDDPDPSRGVAGRSAIKQYFNTSAQAAALAAVISHAVDHHRSRCA